jgi:hypothetical protein
MPKEEDAFLASPLRANRQQKEPRSAPRNRLKREADSTSKALAHSEPPAFIEF